MNLDKLASEVAITTGLSKVQVKKVLDATFHEISFNVIDLGDQVRINGFGVFTRAHRAERNRKIQGQLIKCQAEQILHFRPYKEQRRAV